MFEQRNQKALESISQMQMVFQVRGGHFCNEKQNNQIETWEFEII